MSGVTFNRSRKRHWLCLLLLLLGGMRSLIADPAPAELKLHRERFRALVAAEWSARYDLAVTPDFWETERDGQTPRRILEARTAAAARENRALRALAHEVGLLDDPSFAAIEPRREQRNALLQQRFEQGQPTYGQPTLGQREFYLYVHDRLRFDLERWQRALGNAAAENWVDTELAARLSADSVDLEHSASK